MSLITSWTDWIQASMAEHMLVALAIVFAVSAGEALLVVGLFVPSTVVLVGAGALTATGSLPFLPVYLAAASGAFLGDALSYSIGRRFGPELARLWPFSRYPHLIVEGHAHFEKRGEWSVFAGRFVPAVKSIIPGIAGMMGMPPGRFAVVNAISSVAWAAAHLLPGVAVGLGAAQLSERELSVGLGVIGTALMLWGLLVVRRSLKPAKKPPA